MNLLKILFPDRCPICDLARPVFKEGVCPECRKKIESVDKRTCIKCGRTLVRNKGYFCDACRFEDHFYDGGRSAFRYRSVVDGLYRFKYMNRVSYANHYAKLMMEELGGYLEEISPDALIPVPIHRKRLIKRGYNQAYELALSLSLLSGIPVNNNIIIRRKNTVAQKYILAKNRALNLKKAFIVVENDVNLRRVVIVDDIFTTGSTIDAMAKELKKAGIDEVFFVSIARAGRVN